MNTNPELTMDRLREVLRYEPETGVFVWIKPLSTRVRYVDEAGTITRKGYRSIAIDGRLYRAHRLAWFWVHGEFPVDQVDHINGVRLDNRIANLRIVTQYGNSQNIRAPRANNKSGFLGVSAMPSGRFRAQIEAFGVVYGLGMYATAEAAAAAHLEAKRRLHPGCTI